MTLKSSNIRPRTLSVLIVCEETQQITSWRMAILKQRATSMTAVQCNRHMGERMENNCCMWYTP